VREAQDLPAVAHLQRRVQVLARRHHGCTGLQSRFSLGQRSYLPISKKGRGEDGGKSVLDRNMPRHLWVRGSNHVRLGFGNLL
jgi:hypothetical protein